MKRALVIFLALVLASLPASANFGNHAYNWVGARVPELLVATCASDVTNQSTYSHTITIPTATDGETLLVIAIFLGEDDATSYTMSSATFDGAGANELADDNGARNMHAAIYSLEMTGAASVTVAPTYSESITSNVTCVFAIRNYTSATADAAVVDNQAAGAALTLTLNPTTIGGFAVGACVGKSAATTFSWGVALAEIEDANHAEGTYSNASAAATGASMAATCTPAANDAAGAAGAFR